MKWVHGANLRGADAIHAASAIEMRCEELVTTDARFNTDTNRPILEALGVRLIRAPDSGVLPVSYKQYTFSEEGLGDQGKPN